MYQSYDIDFKGYWLEKNIEDIPQQPGIYCVYECTFNSYNETVTLHNLLYIGESDNVYDRIKSHEKWSDWQRYIRSGNELCFTYGAVEPQHRNRVGSAFIFAHKPPVNSEYINDFPFETTIVNVTGRARLLQAIFTVYGS